VEFKEKNPEGQQKEQKIEINKKKKDYVTVIGGVTTINLKHPIKFNDVDIFEVKMDFNSLNGAKLCEAEVVSQGRYYSPSSEIKFGQAYQAAVGAAAADLPYEAILELKHSDFDILVEVVKGFLLA